MTTPHAPTPPPARRPPPPSPSRRHPRPLALLLCLAAASAFAAPGASARQAGQTHVFEGSVRDAGTGEPLAGANVSVVGRQARAVTRGDGTFHLTGMAAGVYTLRADRLGYRGATAVVTVGVVRARRAVAESAEVLIELTPSPIALDNLVVTATISERAAAEAVRPVSVNDGRRAAAPDDGHRGADPVVHARGLAGSASAVLAVADRVPLRVEAVARRAGDLKTPGGTLLNTDAELLSGGAGTGYVADWGRTPARMRHRWVSSPPPSPHTPPRSPAGSHAATPGLRPHA